MKLFALRLFALSAVAFLAACGGAQPVPTAPEPAAATVAAEPAAVAVAAATTPTIIEAPVVVAPPAPQDTVPPGASALWKDMTKVERADHMKAHVLPTLGPKFAKWDAKHFKDMKCAGCHGAGAKDKTFKMPNPELPKLPSTPEGFKALSEKKPEAVKFMKEVVTPEMQKLLGLPPFDMKTHQGFGCGACHTFAK
jgi:ABC-type glycerol-3-phosphate transport system substrate-binding protein